MAETNVVLLVITKVVGRTVALGLVVLVFSWVVLLI